MPLHIVITAYLGACIVLAIWGRNRKLGAWGYFFSSIMLTPLVGLLLVLASDPKPRKD